MALCQPVTTRFHFLRLYRIKWGTCICEYRCSAKALPHWLMGSGGTAREIAWIARGISGVVIGDSRIDGGATPEPGKRGLVLDSDVEEDRPIAVLRRFMKRVHLSLIAVTWSSCVDKHIYVHIIFVIIHSQYIFAFVERPCAVSQEWALVRFAVVPNGPILRPEFRE